MVKIKNKEPCQSKHEKMEKQELLKTAFIEIFRKLDPDKQDVILKYFKNPNELESYTPGEESIVINFVITSIQLTDLSCELTEIINQNKA